MNEPHENNLDRDPFADDAQRRRSRLRRSAVREARHARRTACSRARRGTTRGPLSTIRHARPCPDADRGPLR